MDPLHIAGAVAIVASGAAGLVYLARGAWRLSSTIHRLAADLLGDRPAGKPGVVERLDRIETLQRDTTSRLAAVEAQVYPNGGASLHDKVNQIKESVT